MKDGSKSKRQLVQKLSEARNHIFELEQLAAGGRQVHEGSMDRDEAADKHAALMESAFNSSPVGLAIFDTGLRYVKINEALAVLNGIPAEEHIGKTVREVLPDLADQIEPVIQKVIDTGEPVTNVLLSGPVASQPGIIRHWNEHWFPLKDVNGHVTGISAVVEEITERVRAEQNLKTSEEKYKSLAENISSVLMRYDRDCRVVYLSPAAEGITGIPVGCFIGRTNREVGLPEHLCDLWEDSIRQVFQTGQSMNLEFGFPSEKGERTFYLKLAPESDPEGRVAHVLGISTEITERKNMEESLRAAERRLHLVMEQTPAILWTTDKDLRYTLSVGQGLKTLGLSPHEAEGRTMIEVMQTNDLDHPAIASSYRALAGESPTYEIDYNGVYYSTHIEPLLDEQDNIIGTIGICHDITDRKRAEEALRASKDRFHAVLESSRDVLYRINVQTGRFEYISPIAEAIVGYSADELMELEGEEWLTMVHPDDLPAFREGLAHLQDSDTGELVYRQRTRNGDYRWLSNRISMIRDSDGLPLYRFGNIRDITESKHAEERLKRSMSRFELLAESAGELLEAPDPQKIVESLCLRVMEFLGCQAFFNFLVDDEAGKLRLNAYAGIPGDEARKIEWLDFGVAVCGCAARDGCRIVAEHIYTNPDVRTELVKSYGIRAYAAHPLLSEGGKVIGTLSFGTRNRDTFSDDDLSMMKAVTDQVATAMARLRSETEIRRHRDNLEELVKARTMELEEKNRKLEEEISEREKAEKEKHRVETQLAQAQRIEALDRFAGGIAHDLNNILYPIILNLEELLAEEPPNSSRQEILDQTLKAANRQRDLVRKILSFSRRSEHVLQPIQVRPLLEETVKFLKSSLPSTIGIHQNIDARNDVIMGDPIQIQQIVMNLCQNAADAMESLKGAIEIGLTNTHMRSLYDHHGIQAGDYLKLTVKDAGHGMKSEVIGRIFEPFFTSKGHGKGTGMGLSVVHGIVKSHGGAITVESEEGKGSLFTVYLPLSDAHYQDQVSDADSVPPVQGRGKILLIDDEETILSSLQRTLIHSGYRVTALQDGQEAFRLFSEKSCEFDLVITDLTMPGMTGMELAGKIQDVRSDIPIILCTGYNDAISSQEAKSYGIRELLLKPVGTGEIKKVIKRALEH